MHGEGGSEESGVRMKQAGGQERAERMGERWHMMGGGGDRGERIGGGRWE